VPGVFAAGDITAPIQQVAGAVGAGAAAAVAIVHDLVIVGRPLERRA
jgi:thioredoxin reductase